MLEYYSNDVAPFRDIRQETSMNDGSGSLRIGTPAGFGENSFRSDIGHHFLSKIETGKDFKFGINDILAAFIGRFDMRISGVAHMDGRFAFKDVMEDVIIL